MKFRNTAILLVVLIIVGGYVYYTQERARGQPTGQAAAPTVEPALSIDPAQVLTITVQGPTGLTRLSRASADSPWQMDTTVPLTDTVSGAQEADPVRASNTLSIVSHISSNRVLTGVTDLAAYGLASPPWSVIVEGAGPERHTIYLGDKNPDGSSYYAKRDGSAAVYLVPAYTGDDLRGLVENPPVKPTPTPTPTQTPTPAETGTPLPAVSPTATAMPGGTPLP